MSSSRRFEVTAKRAVEETLDHVLAVIREAWAENAGLKTYGEAVAESMEARLGTHGKLPMSVERWRKFAAQVSFGEARERAKSMGIEVFWDWDLPRTPEGFYPITGGRDMATARGLAMAPFCDLVWRETAKPDLEDDKIWAEAMHAGLPGQAVGLQLVAIVELGCLGFYRRSDPQFCRRAGQNGLCF